ncbi:MAG TPA: hypothetical protein PKA44_09315 [Saprospiraceae bacterium]|nr:hypothetical protein [Saprospiraceae bacterium]
MTKSEAIDLIISIKEYMDNRADISTNDPSCPNVEMSFSKQLDELLKKMEAQQIIEIVPIGTKVRVTKRLYGHNFKIGEVVKVIKINVVAPEYLCSNTHHYWWLSREEFEPV